MRAQGSLADLQTVKHKLAEMKTECVVVSRRLADRPTHPLLHRSGAPHALPRAASPRAASAHLRYNA